MPISTNWNSTQKIPHTFFTHFNWTTVIFDFLGKLTYHGELLKLEMSGESSATSEAAAQFATVAFRTASSVPQLLNYTLLERDTFDETACWPMQTSMWTVICWINQSHLLANKEGVGDKYHAVLRNFHDGTFKIKHSFWLLLKEIDYFLGLIIYNGIGYLAMNVIGFWRLLSTCCFVRVRQKSRVRP